jgi:hypothetical protein
MKATVTVSIAIMLVCLADCKGRASLNDSDPYQGVKIGDSKAEVLKTLGAPSLAFDEKVEHLDPSNQHPFLNNPDIPRGSASPEDTAEFIHYLSRYDNWHYDNDDLSKPMVIIFFDKSTNRVTKIQCGIPELKSDSCEPLGGIDSFSTRDDEKNELGDPEISLPKSSKQFEEFQYPSKGIEIVFDGDGRVSFIIKRPKSSWFSRLPLVGTGS